MSVIFDIDTAMAAVAGGLLIGLAAVILLLGTGRIAGVSGHLGALTRGETLVSLPFIAGLLLSPWLFAFWHQVPRPHGLESLDAGFVILAGALVGTGTQLANGCTSGHGICGLANSSPRSLVAVLTFMSVAAFVVAVAGRHS